MSTRIGLVGLGSMGAGLAENFTGKNIEVAAWDKYLDDPFLLSSSVDSGFQICESLETMVEVLKPPRCILLSIRTGSPVDDILLCLSEMLKPGDVVADCGNSFFKDSERRERALEAHGIRFLGVGISGGPEGARSGPAIMAGGNLPAWEATGGLFETIAARAGGEPCCAYFGGGGAGHFVKMVHNGIEYAVMQLLLEVYAYLRQGQGADPARIASVFQEIDSGISASYLTGVTARVVAARSPVDRDLLIDLVDPRAGQKGTGQWAVQTALELGLSVPTLAEALMTRNLSNEATPIDRERVGEPRGAAYRQDTVGLGAETLISKGVGLAFISAFAQGLAMCARSQPLLGFQLDPTTVLRSWRRGCILRGAVVELLLDVLGDETRDANILNDEALYPTIEQGLEPLRCIVSDSVTAGVPAGGLASALAYVESMTGHPLPTQLIQLQRDFFGQHGLNHREDGRPLLASWSRDGAET
jgi:6-phosphogluconate dehydrogenase